MKQVYKEPDGTIVELHDTFEIESIPSGLSNGRPRNAIVFKDEGTERLAQLNRRKSDVR